MEAPQPDAEELWDFDAIPSPPYQNYINNVVETSINASTTNNELNDGSLVEPDILEFNKSIDDAKDHSSFEENHEELNVDKDDNDEGEGDGDDHSFDYDYDFERDYNERAGNDEGDEEEEDEDDFYYEVSKTLGN